MKIKNILLFASLTFGFRAFAQPEPEAVALDENKMESVFYESLKQRGIENYDKAVVLLDGLIFKDPSNAAFLYELGKNHLSLKQYAQAENAFQKAVDLQPEERWYIIGLYDVYYESKEYEKAIPIVQKLIAFSPNMQDDLVSLYMFTNQLEAAYDLLLEMESKDVLSQQMEYYKLRLAKKYAAIEPIEDNLKSAIADNPKIEQNYISLIQFYSQSGQDNKAMETAESLAENLPNSNWAQISLFKMYLQKKNIAEAEKALFTLLKESEIDLKIKHRVFNEFLIEAEKDSSLVPQLFAAAKYLEIDKTMDVYSEVGKYFIEKKQDANALLFLEKALNINPENISTTGFVIQLYEKQDKFNEIQKLAENQLELFPTQPILNYYLGLAYNKQQNPQKAVNYLKDGADYVIEDPVLLKKIYQQLTESYTQLNNSSKANEYKQKADKL